MNKKSRSQQDAKSFVKKKDSAKPAHRVGKAGGPPGTAEAQRQAGQGQAQK